MKRQQSVFVLGDGLNDLLQCFPASRFCDSDLEQGFILDVHYSLNAEESSS